jgi:hypothetical protein
MGRGFKLEMPRPGYNRIIGRDATSHTLGACPDISQESQIGRADFLAKDTGYVRMLCKVSISESGGPKILCDAVAFSTY